MEQRLIALAGPGDSGKSAGLDDFHNLLGDRWNIPFVDTDFFGVDVSQSILIKAVLVGLPASLRRQSAFGFGLVDSTPTASCTKTRRTTTRQPLLFAFRSTLALSRNGQSNGQTETAPGPGAHVG